MSKDKWTPGPWSVLGREDRINWIDVSVGDQFCVVAYVRGATNPMADSFAGASQLTGNSNLISAAPELIESLEDLYALIDEQKEYLPMGKVATNAYRMGRAFSAIKKARGDS